MSRGRSFGVLATALIIERIRLDFVPLVEHDPLSQSLSTGRLRFPPPRRWWSVALCGVL